MERKIRGKDLSHKSSSRSTPPCHTPPHAGHSARSPSSRPPHLPTLAPISCSGAQTALPFSERSHRRLRLLGSARAARGTLPGASVEYRLTRSRAFRFPVCPAPPTSLLLELLPPFSLSSRPLLPPPHPQPHPPPTPTSIPYPA